MIKKLIALVLVLLMVVPMIASCGDDKPEKNNTDETQNKPVGDDEDPINAEIDKYVSDLAASHNFNGKTFTWVGGGQQAPEVAEVTGTIEQDALYYRQRDIEDKFGIKWTNYQPSHVEGGSGHPVVDAVNQDVLAGTKAYDAGYGTVVAVCQPLFINNSLADVSGYNTIDFDREWWTATLRDTYHFNGGIYFLNGAIVTSNYQDTYCVMFNKDVAADYGIEGLYDLVKEKKWTFDKMFEVASVIPSNENGAGAYRYANPSGVATVYASGLSLTQFNEDGMPYVAEKLSPELSNLCDKFSQIYGDDTQTINRKFNSVAHSDAEDFEAKYGYKNYDEAFVDGKALFYFEATGSVAGLRKEEVEFGILPMPMGSETQENYISYAEPWGAFNVFVPKSTNDHSVTDVILEAMAALGYRYIKPAYYENILKTRTTHDTDSKDMIDIVFTTKVYDIIDFLATGGSTNEDSKFVKVIKAGVQETSEGLANKYMIAAKGVNRNITSLFAKLEASK